MYIEGQPSTASTDVFGVAAVDDDDFEIDNSGVLSVKGDPIPIVSQSSGGDVELEAMINGYYANKITLQDVQSVWAIGDTRDITIGAIDASGTAHDNTQTVNESHHEQVIAFEILDFNHDILTTAIGSITKALITVDQKSCLISESCGQYGGSTNTENGNMHYSDSNSQLNCQRRKQCNGGYYNALPQQIQRTIKLVDKLTARGSSLSVIDTSSEYVFLLSEIEIFNSNTYSAPGEGTQYAQFANHSANKVKMPYQRSGAVSNYYQLRSPRIDNYESFCGCSQYLAVDYDNATYSRGLAPAFAL